MKIILYFKFCLAGGIGVIGNRQVIFMWQSRTCKVYEDQRAVRSGEMMLALTLSSLNISSSRTESITDVADGSTAVL